MPPQKQKINPIANAPAKATVAIRNIPIVAAVETIIMYRLFAIFAIIAQLFFCACSSTDTNKKPKRVQSLSMAKMELFEILDDQKALLESAKKHSLSEKSGELADKYRKLDARWNSYIDRYEDDLQAKILYGKFLRSIGEDLPAYKIFLQVQSQNPNIAVVNQQLASYEGDCAMAEKALQHIKEAIRLDGECAIYVYQYAELLLALKEQYIVILNTSYGNLNKEITDSFKKAISLSQNNRQIKKRFAESFFEKTDADWNNALPAWNDYIKTCTLNIEKQTALLGKARVLAELYKDKEALQTLALVDLPQLKSERQRIENIIKAK